MLIDRVFAQARATPDKAALVHNGMAYGYAGFARRIAHACRRLSAHGLPTGGVIVLSMGNLADAWVWGIAARRLGLHTAVLPDAASLASAGLRKPAAFVSVEGEPHAEPDAWAGSGLPHLRVPGARALGEQGELTAPHCPHRPGGNIQMTSGTTGSSKKILRDALDEEAALQTPARHYGIDEASVVFVRDFPLSTAGGFRWPLMTWLRGGTVVLQQWKDYVQPYVDLQLTHAFATPQILTHLVGARDGRLRRDERLRLLVTGGTMPHVIADAVRGLLTPRLYALLGSTEAQTIGLTLIESHQDLNWHRILPEREVQVVDEGGSVLPAGVPGLLRIRIQDDVRGYLDDEAASRSFFRDDWFYPGDLGVLRADGRLALQGRITDVINVMGSKIAAGPVEQGLQNRLRAEGVCVFSMQNEAAGEDLHVVIQTRHPVARAELEAIARGTSLSVFPNIHFHFVDELPRNAMGKVKRLELKNRLRERGAFSGKAPPAQESPREK